MSQQFCLKWNSHTTNLLSVFKGFQSSETLVDVTLSCEGRNMKAHKLVLSACSPYFQNLFSENPCKHPIVIINGMRFTDIKAILDFMYKGEVNVSHDELSAFLKAAEALKVKGLTEVCGENQASKVAQVAPQVAETVVPPPPQAPPRADSPNKRRKIRKRSLSDSNRSDEGVSRKREPSPEVHELSGDGYTGDAKHDGPTINSLPRVPPNAFSRSHHSSAASIGSEAASEDDDYEIEPSKLLEQTLTTDNVPSNNQLSSALVPVSSESVRGLQQKTSTPNLESSDMQGPDSPPDIKPMIQFDDSALSSGAGPSDGALVYSDQSLSQPGPSNYQDGALMLHDNSQSQGIMSFHYI
ncbi:protein bric-a-brac 2-like [Stegodyphus dumicola]|uniref:protein bric-a-brac 2-like n=1 Tax=Stegodyphus dumicola TaxID=202533 RepID=UPI0015AA5C43|nr:protein bric-a-brac 2-like [Stegodyphus dumicola]